MSIHGDLGLGLRHEDEPPRRSPRLTGRGRGAVIAAVVLALVAVLGVGVVGVRAVSRALTPGDYSGAGSGSVTVQVRTGDTASDIGATLAKANVVKTVGAFRRAAVDDSRSSGIQPGYYRLRTGMSANAALALLLQPSARVSSRVVIPEGTQLADTLQIISTSAHIGRADLDRAAAAPASLGLPALCQGHLEGCLFPATYEFPPGTTAVEALGAMVDRFTVAAGEVGLVPGAAALHLSPYQVLTVASLLEKEVRQPADFPKVARVVYNRLAKGDRLRMDSTVVYVTKNKTGRVSTAETEISSPYNTYQHAGLPPTAINSPGAVALRAALHPAAGPWRWFITVDKTGRTLFTDNYAEFVQWKALARRNGVL